MLAGYQLAGRLAQQMALSALPEQKKLELVFDSHDQVAQLLGYEAAFDESTPTAIADAVKTLKTNQASALKLFEDETAKYNLVMEELKKRKESHRVAIKELKEVADKNAKHCAELEGVAAKNAEHCAELKEVADKNAKHCAELEEVAGKNAKHCAELEEANASAVKEVAVHKEKLQEQNAVVESLKGATLLSIQEATVHNKMLEEQKETVEFLKAKWKSEETETARLQLGLDEQRRKNEDLRRQKVLVEPTGQPAVASMITNLTQQVAAKYPTFGPAVLVLRAANEGCTALQRLPTGIQLTPELARAGLRVLKQAFPVAGDLADYLVVAVNNQASSSKYSEIPRGMDPADTARKHDTTLHLGAVLGELRTLLSRTEGMDKDEWPVHLSNMTGASLPVSAFRSSLNIETVLQGLLKSVYGLSKQKSSNLDLSYQRQYHFTLLIDAYLRDNGFSADLMQSAYYFIKSVQGIRRFREINLSVLHAEYLAGIVKQTGGVGQLVRATKMPECPVAPTAHGGALVVVTPAFVTAEQTALWTQRARQIAWELKEEYEEETVAPPIRRATTAATKPRKRKAEAPAATAAKTKAAKRAEEEEVIYISPAPAAPTRPAMPWNAFDAMTARVNAMAANPIFDTPFMKYGFQRRG
jgi:hypothetical protein